MSISAGNVLLLLPLYERLRNQDPLALVSTIALTLGHFAVEEVSRKMKVELGQSKRSSYDDWIEGVLEVEIRQRLDPQKRLIKKIGVPKGLNRAQKRIKKDVGTHHNYQIHPSSSYSLKSFYYVYNKAAACPASRGGVDTALYGTSMLPPQVS